MNPIERWASVLEEAAHLRADGTPCPYLHNGEHCNKCGFTPTKEAHDD